MEELNLSSCSDLTSRGLAGFLAISGPSIKTINLAWNNLSDEVLTGFNTPLPNLEHLDLEFCTDLTANGLSQLLEKFGSSLKSLKVCGTNASKQG